MKIRESVAYVLPDRFLIEPSAMDKQILSRHMLMGWGSGYVVVSPEHPLYMVSENDSRFEWTEEISFTSSFSYHYLELCVDMVRGSFKAIDGDWYMVGFDTREERKTCSQIADENPNLSVEEVESLFSTQHPATKEEVIERTKSFLRKIDSYI